MFYGIIQFFLLNELYCVYNAVKGILNKSKTDPIIVNALSFIGVMILKVNLYISYLNVLPGFCS